MRLVCNCSSDSWEYKIRQFKLFLKNFSCFCGSCFCCCCCFQKVMVLYRCFLFNLQSVSASVTPFDGQRSWELLWYMQNCYDDARISTAYTHFSKVIYEDFLICIKKH